MQLGDGVSVPSAVVGGWPEVRIACVWLPQLPLRVEVLRQPAWDGRPLVLGGAPGGRQVVQLCSPEAEQAGLRPGLPLREVVARCPDAIVVRPDPVRVGAVLERVLTALQRVSPAVEPLEERLLLDLGGLRSLYGGDLGRLERAIREVIPAPLRPRLGIASGRLTAEIAARAAPPGGRKVVPKAATVRFLAPRPVGELPFTLEQLRQLELLGLRTVAELAALPFGAVQARFGPAGARAWRLAHGQDDEPLVPHRPGPTARARLRLAEPLGSVEAVLVALAQLLLRTFNAPALRGRAARQVWLRALLSDGSSWERLFTFKEALSERETARRALRSKLELPNGLPPAPIEELELELLGLSVEVGRQPRLLEDGARSKRPLAEVARQLSARYGQVPLGQVGEVEPWSRLPERRWALLPVNLAD
jgi:nucleotidyltransferase/DNA polymerase involved in DNA repair